MIGALLLLSLAGAPDVPAVAMMPLRPGGGSTAAHASGMDLRLREIAEVYDFVKLLPLRDRDDKRVDRCKGKVPCLGQLAHRRGAELLATGVVWPHESGFAVVLTVVEPRGQEPLREVREVVSGDDAQIARTLDLLARRAFAPHEVFAHIAVLGQPEGAEVRIDEVLIGTLPLDDAEGVKVVAGEHTVEISMPGFDPLSRRVKPGFRDTAVVEIELTATLGDQIEPPPPAVPMAAVALFSGAGASVALGALAGTFALLDGQEVERRAAAQQLAFPRDNGLMFRGQALAWTANVLYLAGAGLAGGGAYLMLDDS